VTQASAKGDVVAKSFQVDFGKPFVRDGSLQIGISFFINLMARNPKRVTLRSDSSSPPVFDEFDPPDRDSIHITLKHPDLKLKLSESTPTPNADAPEGEQSIIFDGQIKAGQAVAFIGTFTGASGTLYHHLVVWEAFRAEKWEVWSFQGGSSGISCDWWIRNGPAKMRTLADIAVVWASRAKHAANDPPVAYSVTLENGATVKLLGLCRPERYNFCWWDGAGDPIDAPMQIGLLPGNIRTPSLRYGMEIHGATTEPDTPVPANSEFAPFHSGPSLFVSSVPASGEIKVNVGIGPWKQIGECNSDKPLVVDRITYTITRKEPQGDNDFYVLYKRSAEKNDIMALTAISNDGSEVGSREGPIVNDGVNTKTDSATFRNLSMDQVKTFHLWLRTGHVVSFADFATSPNEKPPESVTREEVLAASANFRPGGRP